MQIIQYLAPLILIISWLSGIILFERFYMNGIFARFLPGYSKAQYCKGWAIGEIFLYLLCGPAMFMFALIMLFTFGVSHYFLCSDEPALPADGDSVSANKDTVPATRNSVVTVFAVIINVPSAIKQAAVMLKPYIK